MAGGIDEPPLHTRLLQKLQGDVSTDSLSCSIFKVPNHLRQISEKAYEPQVISIGPYHHGKGQLMAMEVHKMFYLKMLLQRRKESSPERYVSALKMTEKNARKFYSEPLDHIGGEKFVEMMLLDGCFIIELIRKSAMEELRSENDHLLTHFLLRRVMRDLLLVENQLPFFILSELFGMTVISNDKAKDFMDMAINFFSRMMPGSQTGRIANDKEIKHLLGLLHSWHSSEVVLRSPPQERPIPPRPTSSFSWLWFSRPPKEGPNRDIAEFCSVREERIPRRKKRALEKWRFISSAIELSEAGINFKKIEGGLFDIKFENGVMSIPTLGINDDTESILRNLVAYEQCSKGASPKCFTDYLTFMDCLINTGKDVELLCRRGVIDNWLGDHEVVATLFNKLRDSVSISEEDFFYAETFNKVNKHCDKKWNQWKANLWHNYFNTPWAGISFFAAVFLLLLTVLQSVYSVLSYLFK